MPKVIENLKENILRCAKAALLSRGYGELSIRGVAKECGIAVGTVYNYFPSKEMLAASVILEDWLAALEGMRGGCAAADGAETALTVLYRGVEDFYNIYRSVWTAFTFSGTERSVNETRHDLLVRQLADCILPVLLRVDARDAADTALFFAENALLCAGGSALTFEQLMRIARRLLA